MKIAFFLSAQNIVPPLKTGGIEQPAFYLIEELAKRKHEVVLFAGPGSKIPGVKVREISPFVTTNIGVYSNLQERVTNFYDLNALAEFFSSPEANSFDVIVFCNYIFYEILPFLRWTKTPVLIQVNYPHEAIYPYLEDRLKQYENVFYMPMSNFVKKMMPGLPYVDTIYPVFDLEDFKFSPKVGKYLLSIGRICREKAPHLAIATALKAKKQLVIVGGVSEPDKDYFEKIIKPYIDNKRIIFKGEVDFITKIKIYRQAIATLFTSQWSEPFGIVQIESMAVGTPVITFKRAAAEEIVKNGLSGFIVKDGDTKAMAKAVGQAEKLDRLKVREYVAKKFSVKKETDKFEKIVGQLRTNKL